MANDHVLRFAVGGPDAPRSAIWRLFTHRDEAYLGVRQIAGMYKVSFHSGGVCQEALTSAVATGADRGGRRWYRPSPATGLIELYRVVVVPRLSFRREPISVGDERKGIAWFPPPPEGAIGMVKIGVGPSGAIMLNAVALPLGNGETIYVRYDIDAEPRGLITDSSASLRSQPQEIKARLIGGPWSPTAQPRAVVQMQNGELRFALELVNIQVNIPVDGAAA